MHVLIDFILLDSGSIQLPEMECSTAAHCNNLSDLAAFCHPFVVRLVTRCVSWVHCACPVNYVEIIA